MCELYKDMPCWTWCGIYSSWSIFLWLWSRYSEQSMSVTRGTNPGYRYIIWFCRANGNSYFTSKLMLRLIWKCLVCQIELSRSRRSDDGHSPQNPQMEDYILLKHVDASTSVFVSSLDYSAVVNVRILRILLTWWKQTFKRIFLFFITIILVTYNLFFIVLDFTIFLKEVFVRHFFYF